MTRRRHARLRRRVRRAARPLLAAALVLLVVLPAVLTAACRLLPPPPTPLMVIRALQGDGMERHWRPLAEIAPSLRFAVIAAEDNLFCSHHGFDFGSLRDAVTELLDGGRMRGASTISMQTARNLYLWPARNFLRKAVEAYLTVYVEALLPKRRILELYLNIAEWGPGVFGAEAAARHHFGKPAAALSERESALLAAILPSPRRWSTGDDHVRRQAAVVRKRIGQLGALLDCVRDV